MDESFAESQPTWILVHDDTGERLELEWIATL
jgi:hypothetical protein